MNLSENTIIAEIKASGRLPSPTGVALTILELTRDPQANIIAFGGRVSGEPGPRDPKFLNSP